MVDSEVIGSGNNNQSFDCGRYGVKSVKGWDLRLERLEIGSRENGDFWDWEWDFDLILRSENKSEMRLNSSKTEACVWILWNSIWDGISISILTVLSFYLLLIWSLLLLIWFLLLQRRLWRCVGVLLNLWVCKEDTRGM